MSETDRKPDEPDRKPHDPSPGVASVEEALRLMREFYREGEGGPVADAVSAALLTVLGSGPSVATLQSLIAANQASGVMYQNAVANQQLTNVLGMVATMNCVQVLLDKEPSIPWPDISRRTGGWNEQG